MSSVFKSTGSEHLDKMLKLPNQPRVQPAMITTIELEDAPKNCDLCEAAITDKFVDGAIKNGPWGVMCPQCHKKDGIGLGTGRGQLYVLQANAIYLKTDG